MIGILIAAHSDMGPALRRVAEGIVGPMEQTEAISLGYDVPPDEAQRRIEQALQRLDTGEGVLILTDMFGGTPTNLTVPFLETGRVEVLSGVNLPMVIKAHVRRLETSLAELARFLRDYGARNIVLASEKLGARHHPPV
jgi:PTS system mannose-specific IIA component